MQAAFSLSKNVIDTQYLLKQLDNTSAGALVTFEGRVRHQNANQNVLRLEYEAFSDLALTEGQRIIDEALQRHDILAAYCVHRTGLLELGEIAVWIGVIAPHRAAAFDACRYIIDELKRRVPIWKKEHYTNGHSEWLNCSVGS